MSKNRSEGGYFWQFKIGRIDSAIGEEIADMVQDHENHHQPAQQVDRLGRLRGEAAADRAQGWALESIRGWVVMSGVAGETLAPQVGAESRC